ncbi:hypothetical protein [Halobaculum sp. MBLA0143]
MRETTAALDLPRRTVYDDVETLRESWFVGDDGRPERYAVDE